MICVLTTPIDLANYMDVWNLRERFPDQRVCHISFADFSGMQADETLYLLGHGSTTQIEEDTPVQLAQKLVARGLTVPIDKIKLLVCESGIIGPDLPYCQQLADALVPAGGPATYVVGFDGNAVTDEFGRTYATDAPQNDYPDAAQHFAVLRQWNTTAEGMTYRTEEEILTNARTLQAGTAQTFAWLHENNRPHLKPSVVGKTYGIPGQVFPAMA